MKIFSLLVSTGSSFSYVLPHSHTLFFEMHKSPPVSLRKPFKEVTEASGLVVLLLCLQNYCLLFHLVTSGHAELWPYWCRAGGFMF